MYSNLTQSLKPTFYRVINLDFVIVTLLFLSHNLFEIKIKNLLPKLR